MIFFKKPKSETYNPVFACPIDKRWRGFPDLQAEKEDLVDRMKWTFVLFFEK
jgi:hypothetical protein